MNGCGPCPVAVAHDSIVDPDFAALKDAPPRARRYCGAGGGESRCGNEILGHRAVEVRQHALQQAGVLLATANVSADNTSVFSYPTGPPSASIASPATGATFTVGQTAVLTFSCADATYGPGIASCDDSHGTNTTSGGTGTLDTSRLEAVYGVRPRPWRDALAEIVAELKEQSA